MSQKPAHQGQPRPKLDEFFMAMLDQWATRSTCGRRHVAAIITDVAGKILSAGYNGVPSGYPHCRDTGGEDDRACPGRTDPSGNSSRCMAIHAEQNAMLQCHRLDLAHTIYVHCSPCLVCAKLIANTSIQRVVFFEVYTDQSGAALLDELNVDMVYLSRDGRQGKG